ncbi:alpha/beta hydrolase [Mycolicibacterium litorale]|nr:alpha/beta hydrolase [Mycolicibacterium litorale]
MRRWGSAQFATPGCVLTLIASCVIPMPTAAADPGSTGYEMNWHSCDEWVDIAKVPTAQCTTVSVPVQWSQADDPQTPRADLAVMRVPATGKRIGILISNPGGPGTSAVDVMARFAPKLAQTEIGKRFDLIAIDPRGIGHSSPQLRCQTDAEIDEDRREPDVDYSPAGVQRIEDHYRQIGQLCLDRMGAAFLAAMSTDDSARDMDAVRAALGEEQINFLGYSYGSRLGTSYAGHFPDRVRAMMLDGVVDQNADPLADDRIQAAGFQQAFDAYAADCATSAQCPLGTDPARFVTRFRQLVDPLVTKPAATADPRGLSYGDAAAAVDEALYSDDDWDTLTEGLDALAHGRNADVLLQLADDNLNRDPDGHYSNLLDVFNAVHCVDTIFPSDPAPWIDNDRQIRELAPFESYGQFTGDAPRPQCVFWPVAATTTAAPVTSPGPGKMVVVSTTGDPATPYQVGVEVAAALGAPLITYRGAQHTVAFSGVPCVDSALTAFFVDGVQPPADLQC